MRRIDDTVNMHFDWEKSIDVQVSRKELALICAVLGRTTPSEDEVDFDNSYGGGKYNELIGSEGDDMFFTMKRILREEGVLEVD